MRLTWPSTLAVDTADGEVAAEHVGDEWPSAHHGQEAVGQHNETLRVSATPHPPPERGKLNLGRHSDP